MRVSKIISLVSLTALPLLQACTAQTFDETAEGKANLARRPVEPGDPGDLPTGPRRPPIDIEPPPGDPATTPDVVKELTSETLEVGDGWRRVRVKGTATDADTGALVAVDRTLVVVQDKSRIESSPLPAFVKSDVTAELAAKPAPTPAGGLPPDAAYAPAPEEGSALIVDETIATAVAAKASAPGPATTLAFCADYDKTLQKSLSVSKSYANDQTFDSGGFTGKFAASASLVANATGKIVVRVKRKVCVPYAVDFKYAQITGSAKVTAKGKIDGQFSKSYNWEKTLAQPVIGVVPLSIAGIPLDVTFTAPIRIGLDASAKAKVTFDGSVVGNGSFDVVCTKSGCNGSKSATATWGGGAPPTMAVDGRADAEPYAFAGIHANIYSDWVGYGEIGLKAKLRGELWAYYGNACGDGDGDGVNEYVNAAMVDVRAGVDLVGKAGVIGNDYGPWTYPLLDKHLAFYDLAPGGSTAASPLLTVATPIWGGTAIARTKMRPCWPWSENMKYRIDWSDGAADDVTSSPSTLVSKSHAYATTGLKTITATPIVDDKGRGPGRPSTKSVNVGPRIGLPEEAFEAN